MDKWDSLFPDALGEFCFIAIDIVGHSILVKENPYEVFERIFDAFGDLVEKHVRINKGRLWSWAGDGGLAAFYEGKNISAKVKDAIQASFSILSSLENFNKKYAFPTNDKIKVRIAVHSGYARYRKSVARIHSKDINFVCHLEHRCTHPNSISISEEVRKEIVGTSYVAKFVPAGDFEDHRIHTTDKEKGGSFNAALSIDHWLEIRNGLETICEQIASKIDPSRTIIISANRSGAVFAGMLAPNLGIGPVIVFSRPERKHSVNHFVELTPVLQKKRWKIILTFFTIASLQSVRELTRLLESRGVNQYMIVAMYALPAVARRLREDLQHPLIYAYDRDDIVADEFWNKILWNIRLSYNHR